MIDPKAALAALALLGLAGCGGGEPAAENNMAAAVEDPAPTPAEIEADAELANDAAADEAADMEAYGGNAAAMETGNGQ